MSDKNNKGSGTRVSVLSQHLDTSKRVLGCSVCSKETPTLKHSLKSGQRTIPRNREEVVKWNGWGYNDSKFAINENDEVVFTGSRYKLSGLTLPSLRKWMTENIGIELDQTSFSVKKIDTSKVPEPIVNENFKDDMFKASIEFSTDPVDRLVRSHGHTCDELFILRRGDVNKRLPDAVVFPLKHDHVVSIVQSASANDVCLIPIGGGTSVTWALICPENEKRMVVMVDMTQMSRILWVDEKNLLACAEAGIVGQDLERDLHKLGLCTGHEPDSMEFSSLGGWVATRASGMKKNVYGNIEDLVVHAKMVTPKGTLEKKCMAPRVSAGPDLHQFILGSEGTLGIVSEVTMRIRHLPKTKKYGSIVFPDFEHGVDCLREIAKQRCAPASIRLMDNAQFKFGQALKPEAESIFTSFIDGIKKFYVTRLKGYDPANMCVATLLFEGDAESVEQQEKQVYKIAGKHQGMPAGEENGQRGYMLTFVIAYLRDIGFDYEVVSESFETSAPWDRIKSLCKNVKERITHECQNQGVKYPILSTCRVTQTYDAGACVYFYLAFKYRGLPDPLESYMAVEDGARDEILQCGGSISHHHGIGKLRKQFVPRAQTEAGVGAVGAVKKYLDPKNVFGNGNLIDPEVDSKK